MDLPFDTEAGTGPVRLPIVARWRPTLRAVLVVAAVVLVCGFVIAVMTAGPSQSFRPTGFGFDTRSYWGMRMPLYPGPGTDDGYGVYRYSPAFVPFLLLASSVPWPVFATAWIAMLVGIYIWMAGDDKWPLLVFVPVLFEFYLGNVHLLLALAVVLGFRWPATWAFVLLTKITPGIGLWWFVVRREWRPLAIALGVTAAIVTAGLMVAPGAWRDWYVSLTVTAPAVGTEPGAHTPAGPAACRVPAGDLGRPNRSTLDRDGGRDARTAHALVPRPGHAGRHRRPGARPARATRSVHRTGRSAHGTGIPRVPPGPRRGLTHSHVSMGDSGACVARRTPDPSGGSP